MNNKMLSPSYLLSILLFTNFINCSKNNPFSSSGSSLSSSPAGGPPLAGCFCSLSSETLDDCPCSASKIEILNKDLNPLLVNLLAKNYFRYFQVDFSRPCKFWPDGDGKCSNPNCAIDTCTESQLPIGLRQKDDDSSDQSETSSDFISNILATFPWLEPYYITLSQTFFGNDNIGCEDPYPQHHKVDRSLPDHLTDVQQFCPLDPEGEEADCKYVDLVNNEEKFTGFSGRASNKVWEKIYGELCFQPENGKALDSETVKELCLEKRSFYRAVSGLHSSISIHLCTRYLLEEDNPLLGQKAVWGRNIPEFVRRFSPETTGSEGPERLKNLYFVYLLELRAIAKAAPYLLSLEIHTGDEKEDKTTKDLLTNVLHVAREFPDQFDESQLFQGEVEEVEELVTKYKQKFTDIKKMMDCLGCERCKVWGKLQVTGLGTALKILFSPTDKTVDLTRHEVVALLNAFGRLSTSVLEIGNFREAVF